MLSAKMLKIRSYGVAPLNTIAYKPAKSLTSDDLMLVNIIHQLTDLRIFLFCFLGG